MLAFNHLGQLGRLGNQMFQYASLRGISAVRGYDFGIPPSNFEDEWRNHQLFEVFDLPHLPKQNIIFLDGGCAPVVQEKDFTFDPVLLQQCPNEVSLFGFFQSEKWFKHIEESIKEDFTFKDHILNPCKEMIGDNKFLSVHIRRTDYLTNNANHHNLTLDYYEKALSHFDDWDVVIFSDDPDWCKEQKLFSNDRFLISESGDNKVDMCLMTLCKAHIIANSSFSWWGAWLANSEHVIAPSKWFGPNNIHKDTSDLIPEKWQII
jgi:hypothetical protein